MHTNNLQPIGSVYALLNSQGTACAETALFAFMGEYTAANRARVESEIDPRSPDAPVPGTWTDCSENEALEPSDDVIAEWMSRKYPHGF